MAITKMPARTTAPPKRRAPYCWTLPVCMLAEHLADALGQRPGAVDGAVDALPGRCTCSVHRPMPTVTDADAVDDAVEDVLVEPVGGPGDRALDAAGDDVGVEVVEVVLVHEQRVAGAGPPGCARCAPCEPAAASSRRRRDRCRGSRARRHSTAIHQRELGVRRSRGSTAPPARRSARSARRRVGDHPRTPGREVDEAGDDAPGPPGCTAARGCADRTRGAGGGGRAWPRLAVEGEVDAAGHVGRGAEGADETHDEHRLVAAVAAELVGAGEDLVLRPEARQREDADQGQPCR